MPCQLHNFDSALIEDCCLQILEGDNVIHVIDLDDLTIGRSGSGNCKLNYGSQVLYLAEGDVIAMGFADEADFKAQILAEKKQCNGNPVLKTYTDLLEVCVPLIDGSGTQNGLLKLCSDGTYVLTDFENNILNQNLYDMGKAFGSVGVAKIVAEKCAALKQDFCAVGGDRTLTKADIVAFAVAQGLLYSDGTPVTATAVIHEIDIDVKLKDVPATDDVNGAVTTTECQADIVSAAGTVTKTGGGSDTFKGEVLGTDLKESSFSEVVITDGSCVEISAGIIEVS